MAKIATASRNSELLAFVKGVHGVRYQVTDVARSVAFTPSGWGSRSSISSFPPLRASLLGMPSSCSAVRGRRDRVRCRRARDRNLAAGTASS